LEAIIWIEGVSIDMLLFMGCGRGVAAAPSAAASAMPAVTFNSSVSYLSIN